MHRLHRLARLRPGTGGRGAARPRPDTPRGAPVSATIQFRRSNSRGSRRSHRARDGSFTRAGPSARRLYDPCGAVPPQPARSLRGPLQKPRSISRAALQAKPLDRDDAPLPLAKLVLTRWLNSIQRLMTRRSPPRLLTKLRVMSPQRPKLRARQRSLAPPGRASAAFRPPPTRLSSMASPRPRTSAGGRAAPQRRTAHLRHVRRVRDALLPAPAALILGTVRWRRWGHRGDFARTGRASPWNDLRAQPSKRARGDESILCRHSLQQWRRYIATTQARRQHRAVRRCGWISNLASTFAWMQHASLFTSLELQLRSGQVVSTPATANFYALTPEQLALLANRGVSASAANTALNFLDSLSGPQEREATRILSFARIDIVPTVKQHLRSATSATASTPQRLQLRSLRRRCAHAVAQAWRPARFASMLLPAAGSIASHHFRPMNSGASSRAISSTRRRTRRYRRNPQSAPAASLRRSPSRPTASAMAHLQASAVPHIRMNAVSSSPTPSRSRTAAISSASARTGAASPT